jgi:hypothetical protein
MRKTLLVVLLLLGTTTTVVAEPHTPKTPSIEQLIIWEAEASEIDSKLAVKIAFCESRLTQFDSDGKVLRGKQNPQDVGIFQINEKYHLEASQKLGYDIYTTEGNIAYGLYLLKKEGSRPWAWSKSCWNTP